MRVLNPHLLRAQLLALPLLAAGHAIAATVPAGFTDAIHVAGLVKPTAMQFAPDGRLFVAEQDGKLRVVQDGVLLATPFVTLPVNSSGERGLLGVAFDPDFASTGFVYVYYTATTPTIHNRISRFTANGNVALAGSEQVLVDLDNLSGAMNHNGGAIHFGTDGKLYVAVGDNALPSNAEVLTNRLGKILRYQPDGTIPPDNPFYAIASDANRAIWALGLRNPFTIAIERGTGRLYINDVGQSTYEEINAGVAGANYGWPGAEGPSPDPADTDPIHFYGRGGGACAITGGAFYDASPARFPAEYSDDYFFADFCAGWIRRLDAPGNAAVGFATGVSFPVDLKVGPDGALYYLSRGTGSVGRIAHSGAVLPTLAIGDAAVLEGAPATTTNAVFPVRLSAASLDAVTVDWTTVNRTAKAGSDYTFASGRLDFAPGATARSITVAVAGDSIVEGKQSFDVVLSSPTGATLADGVGRGTILNDDGAGTLAFSRDAYRHAESRSATITVRRTDGGAGGVSVRYATAPVTATAGADYTSVSGTLVFGPAVSSLSFQVPIAVDELVEGDETVQLNLSDPGSGAVLGARSSAVLTIVDNDD
jgi:glucose/arabinose dehydrogenase